MKGSFLVHRLVWTFLLIFTIVLVANPVQKHPFSFVVLEHKTKAPHETGTDNSYPWNALSA